MRFRYTIVTRFALFFTSLLVLAILLSGYLVFQNASKVIVKNSNDNLKHASDLAQQSFYALLNEVSNDIAVISSSPTLVNYINQGSPQTRQEINNLFQSVLKNKPSYFQIRWIGSQGNEIIRFDKKNNQIIPITNLQDKSNHEYFKETIKMGHGDFYFSEINLNEEHGVISKPHTPTLRAASPIFVKNSKLKGIVIINVNLNTFYKTLDQISNTELSLFLVDSLGQYLYAPNKLKTFGLQTKSKKNFYSDFKPDSVKTITNGFENFTDNHGNKLLSYNKKLSYFNGKRNMSLIASIPHNDLMQSALSVRKKSIHTILLICFLSLLITWFFLNLFSKKINLITKAIRNYEEGITDKIELPTKRKDEIGVLANTFNKMKNTIDQNVLALNKSLKKEKLAKQQRDDFLQNMSHELRTPLNAILGLTELLHKNEPSTSQLPIINSLDRSANSLAALVYDVLDHQKLIDGNLQLENKSVSIAEILQNIHATYQFEAVHKNLSFHLSLDKNLKEHNYLTDSLRLSQIITNLIINAIKYTNKGSISLSGKIVNNNLEVIVQDTGIGIKAENLSKINERFFREKENISGRYGSYGLGLSIVKQLTLLFRGNISASSKLGVGSSFSLSIPVTEVKTKLKNPGIKKIILPQFEKKYQILHIEDDASTLDLIKFLLQDKCIELDQVNNLDAATQKLNANKYHLIISDLILDETPLKGQIKNWISVKKIECPIALLSALEPEIMKEISPYYFQKPFHTDLFKQYIFKTLGDNEFTSPDFSNIYNNYDNQTLKINKVFTLLENEFQTYIDRIELVCNTKNQKEWEGILHKLIAHINNLNLISLSQVLPKNISNLSPEKFIKIKNVFAYYLCCLSVEKQFNLVN